MDQADGEGEANRERPPFFLSSFFPLRLEICVLVFSNFQC